MTNKLSIQNATTGKEERLNYLLEYQYDPTHPHRATRIGDMNYEYDLNGNLTKKYYDEIGGGGEEEEETPINNDPNSADEAFGYTWAESDEPENVDTEYTWDDENRLKETTINGTVVQYQYNAGGDRTSKLAQGKTEVLYVDRLYQLQIGVYKDCITKHIFVGETRIVSKITYEDLVNNAEVEKNNTYFYHPDHLGSSNIITDNNGYEYEHLEYTPYGETWFEESQEPMLNKIAYKFTGKELDTETGLYYFGARYYDAKVSRWISADPIYDGVRDGLGVYTYCRNNPLIYRDPTGLSTDGRDSGTPNKKSYYSSDYGDYYNKQYTEDGKVYEDRRNDGGSYTGYGGYKLNELYTENDNNNSSTGDEVFDNLVNQVISPEDRSKVGKGNGYDFESQRCYGNNPGFKHQGVDIKALVNPDTNTKYDDIDFISPYDEAFYVTKESSGGYGKYVLLYEISGGNVTGNVYIVGHLESFNSDLESWDKIIKGTKLGTMGNTGQCIPASYIHGHVELWINQQQMLRPDRNTDVVKEQGDLKLW